MEINNIERDPTYHISDLSGVLSANNLSIYNNQFSSNDPSLEINNNKRDPTYHNSDLLSVLSANNLSIYNTQKEKVKPSKERGVKKNSCFYCKKLYSRLPEHLQMLHKHEEEVKLFSSMPKGKS